MTSIPLDQLGANAGDDDLRRDRWGRLLVVPPGGGDPVGYTRVTTVAKTTDDGGGLMPWKATMTACGLMMRPGLRARWEALLSAHDGRPWYAGEQSKSACKRLVEECAEAGGAADRREQGTALHAITAQLDRGEALHHLTPETERDIEVYVDTLAAAGVSFRADHVEETVVLDGHQVGGSFDRLADVHGWGLPMIADLKTGEDISYSWGAFAVQLAGYAHADSIYVQGADPNGSTDMRVPMPDVDQRHGLIIHLPAGGARCRLYIVDLVAGWEGFELSMAVRRWRKAKPGILLDKAQPITDAPTQFVAAAVESPAETTERLAGISEADAARLGLRPAEPFVTGHEEAASAAEAVAELRRWLQDRIDVCGHYSDASRADLIRSWPPAMPSLGSSVAHTPDQLAAIEAVLDGVEARNGVPFGPTKPGQTAAPTAVLDRLLHAFPNSDLTNKENPS